MAKNELLDNANNFYKGREKNIGGFKNEIFLLIREDFHSDGDGDFQDQIRLQHLNLALMNPIA